MTEVSYFNLNKADSKSKEIVLDALDPVNNLVKTIGKGVGALMAWGESPSSIAVFLAYPHSLGIPLTDSSFRSQTSFGFVAEARRGTPLWNLRIR